MPATTNYEFNVSRTINREFSEALNNVFETMGLSLVRTTWPAVYAPADEVCHVDYNHNGEPVPALVDDCFECSQCGNHQHHDSRRTFNACDEAFCSDDCLEAYALETSYVRIETSNGSSQWFDLDNSYGSLASYCAVNNRGFETSDEHPFLVGMEVEKSDSDFHELGGETNILSKAVSYDWIAVSDGSLCHDTGFELVSPAYNLTATTGSHGRQELERVLNNWSALNADADSSCGGHITVSALGLSGPQLAARIEAIFPVLFALYPSRVGGEYSGATRGQSAIETGHKFRAINVLHNRVEFRLFSGVQTGEQLSKRVDVLRNVLALILGDNGMLMETEARAELESAIANRESGLWAAINRLIGDTTEPATARRDNRITAFQRWYADGSLCDVTRRYLLN